MAVGVDAAGSSRDPHAIMIKIIAGEYRSRILSSPPDAETTRPYPQRVKESVFNMLRGWFEGARVLDLFAGVGTVGLEAASRGAEHVVMVEKDRRVYRLLQENVASLGCADRVTTILGDALSEPILRRAPQPVDVIFVDPPYAMMEEEPGRQRIYLQAERCRDIMADQSFLVLRSPFGPDACDLSMPRFSGPEAHQYGKQMWVLLYQPRHVTLDLPDADAAAPSG
jgi:16S rRNA (guanine(966)-N(2))-methyltransferase RsmD